jgi:hypothetical protein
MHTILLWLCLVLTPQPECNTQTFEDNSSIKNCIEYREGAPAICTYLYDEFGDLVFWDCSSRG